MHCPKLHICFNEALDTAPAHSARQGEQVTPRDSSPGSRQNYGDKKSLRSGPGSLMAIRIRHSLIITRHIYNGKTTLKLAYTK